MFQFKHPRPLHQGSRIAIVSPASKIAPQLVWNAAEVLEAEGFQPIVMPHAVGECGSFSASADDRLQDVSMALSDSTIDAILCSRGGYGAVHLLNALDKLPAEQFDKWLIGFSDVTALHCLWQRKGMASLHAAMAKYIGRHREFECYDNEMAVLRGAEIQYSVEPHVYNMSGEASGVVVGGNLAVFGGLIGTPYDPFETTFTAERIESGDVEKPLLFIEDVAEPIYKVERQLWQLRLRGVFNRVAGVLVGQFTEYHPSVDHRDMEAMMTRFFADLRAHGCEIPVAFGLPFGHIEANRPLMLGREAIVKIGVDGTTFVQK